MLPRPRLTRHVLCLCLALAAGAANRPTPALAQEPTDPIGTIGVEMQRLYDAGQYPQAIPLAQQLVELNEKRFGPHSVEHATALYRLGNVLLGVFRSTEAESSLRQALAIFSAHKDLADQRLQTEVMLAAALVYQSKLDEGLPLMVRSATEFEATFGLQDPRTVSALNNLAQTLQISGRSAEAGPIYRKLIAVLDHVPQNLSNLGALHANLAAVLEQTGHREDALIEMRSAVGLLRELGNPDSVFLATAISNLGFLEQNAGNLQAAEALYREALGMIARATGPESEGYGTTLMNLSVVQRDLGQVDQSEVSNRGALEIFDKVLGPAHTKTGSVANSLAVQLSARGAWTEALGYYERATAIAVRNARSLGSEDGRVANSVYGLNAGDFPAHMRAIQRVAPDDPKRREEAFGLLQRALNSRTATAISRMAARAATADGALASLVREQQDLLRQRTAGDQALIAALGNSANPTAPVQARAELARIDAALETLDARLKAEFPGYQALDSTEPVPLADIQAALKPHEALVAFVEIEGNPSIGGETHAWVVTSTATVWKRLDNPHQPVGMSAATLRCGLDAAQWELPASRAACTQLTGVAWSQDDAASAQPLPFSAARAYEIYQHLFAPLEDALKLPDGRWRDLLVVASPPLATLPLGVLVTRPAPFDVPPDNESYRRVAWLAQRQPITLLPSVASLSVLRRVASASAATRPMIGFGNPLLDGQQSDPRSGAYWRKQAKRAADQQRCPEEAHPRLASSHGGRARLAGVASRGGLADLRHLRQQAPLPETADELCAVARDLGADVTQMRLGARATEHEVKALSASGELARYRIVHFATHGTLAGQLNGTSEPGLILTPPRTATDDDDGFLSASEITRLKLDADWVILSACNTAAAEGGDGGGANGGGEALSGLARAFFYAGARSLLVSHWAVRSDAAVALITGAVREMSHDKAVGRAEALRRAMATMIKLGTPREAHPEYWGPFVVVGEGSAISAR